MDSTSTKPYLIRAIHEWCCDNGLTPYLAVAVDERVKVPREFVRDGQIVLNISYDATGNLRLGNDDITFQARFSGVAREIAVPVGRVSAIYAKESGAGMAFDVEEESAAAAADAKANEAGAAPAETDGPDAPAPTPGRPRLQRIK